MIFDKNINLSGKHATYLKFLSKKTTELKGDAISAEIFKRHIDVYMAGVMFGLLKNIKAEIDTTNKDNITIFAEQVIKEQSRLIHLYRIVMLLDNKALSDDERIDLAFRYTADADKVKAGMDVFNAYARGGIEWLYEKLTDGATTKEDYLQKLVEIIDEFQQDFA